MKLFGAISWTKCLLSWGICMLLFITIARSYNNVPIIPDSTQQFAQVEISRVKKSTFTITFTDQKGTVLYTVQKEIDATPQLIKIPWSMYADGIYYVIFKSKKEELKMMLFKKSPENIAVQK